VSRVLGIETSCDETAAAIIDASKRPGSRVVVNKVLSQFEDHRPFGGVVPEVAARAHLRHLAPLVAETMTESGLDWDDLDAVAATAGPGLIGGVIVGATFAKALALARNKPFIAVNHLEAHALTPRLSGDAPFPYLLLLVSGGHCQLLTVEGLGRYRLLGTTVDDALGEAFDKTAKMLGLGYPGGPAVEAAAGGGVPGRFALPRPFKGRDHCDFSFSGLKAAVRRTVEKLPEGPPTDQAVADLCRAFQDAAADSLCDRTRRAIHIFRNRFGSGHPLVVAGGVAANKTLRRRLEALAVENAMLFMAPPMALCTDNAAMVAWTGAERFEAGQRDGLGVKPVPRWPLTTLRPAKSASTAVNSP